MAQRERRDEGAPLRLLFLSRITPMKNLDFALRVLARVRTPVEFSIVGPVRDQQYWQRCQGLIDRLPDHIKVSVEGGVPHSHVTSLMATFDLLFLPTRGENYGHVIPEALSSGTPVLIADTTPWRNLERAGVGWDLPLSDEAAFAAAIEKAATIAPGEYLSWRRRAADYARQRLADSGVLEANRSLFQKVAALGG